MKEDKNIGCRYGKLIIKEFVDVKVQWHKRYLCECDCGNRKVIQITSLKSGATKSCGCIQKEWARSTATHGKSTTSTYVVWLNMKARCDPRKNKRGINRTYGFKKITVCERWLKFENFLADMGEKPEGLEIDRINNDGNYEPDNCRWITHKENCQNKSPHNRKRIRLIRRTKNETINSETRRQNL